MTALEWISSRTQGRFPRSFDLSGSCRPRTARADRGLRPTVEGLEAIALLATTCPTISGFVFLDENPTNPALTNNGLFDPGEAPIANAQVELFDSSNLLVATTKSDSTGAYSFGGMTSSTSTTPVTLTQTITVGNPAQPNVPTNFTDQPFVPPLQQFNPNLGTLESVQISSDVIYNSTITISNQSQLSSATGITAMLQGASYQINGLGPGVTISGTPMKSATAPDLPPWNGVPGEEPTTTVNLSVEDKQNQALTSSQDLSFYTATSGQSMLTPLMTALGGGTASASNGNGEVTQTTLVATTLTVTYTYLPTPGCLINPGVYKIVQSPTPPNVTDGKASENGVVFANPGSPQMLSVTVNSTSDNLINNDFGKLNCPVPGPIKLFGVHHQQTRLVLPFTGIVNPTVAQNPSNYTVIISPTEHVPIKSAKYNPATNSVTLIPARHLNFHDHYTLSFHLPCSGGPGQLENIPFGGKQSLAGFLTENHRRFISVSHGRIVH
jgi:hypothetical protein